MLAPAKNISGPERERERRKRRRFILSWVPYGIMAVLIVVAVVLVIGFNNSWWVESKPVASAQQEYHGQSLFTQAGIDYAAKRGRVTVSLAADRPSAATLGLPRSGTRTISYIVPLTIEVAADGAPIRRPLADTLTLRTTAGRVSAVLFTDDRAYATIRQRALDLLAATGSPATAASFDAALTNSRAASGDRSYDAVGDTTAAGVRSHVELSGTPSTAKLTISLTPA